MQQAQIYTIIALCALECGGRSARLARQFIDGILAKNN